MMYMPSICCDITKFLLMHTCIYSWYQIGMLMLHHMNSKSWIQVTKNIMQLLTSTSRGRVILEGKQFRMGKYSNEHTNNVIIKILGVFAK